MVSISYNGVNMNPSIHIAILISGNGSNMENLIVKLHNKTLSQALQDNGIKLAKNNTITHHTDNSSIYSHNSFIISHNNMNDSNTFLAKNPIIKCIKVISNTARAYGLQRAANLGIESHIIESTNKNREDFDRQLSDYLCNLINNEGLNYILLAGFMRILGKKFFSHMPSSVKILNIHPSFLPLHKGANAIHESFYDTNDYGGVSIHHVIKEVDSGNIILQDKVLKIPNESLESFTQRIHQLEYKLYPQAFLKVVTQGI